MSIEYPFTCSDGHVEIGFNVEAPDGDERCPLCLLRDQILLEIAQPRLNYELFNLGLSSAALHAYPYHENEKA